MKAWTVGSELGSGLTRVGSVCSDASGSGTVSPPMAFSPSACVSASGNLAQCAQARQTIGTPGVLPSWRAAATPTAECGSST